MGALPVELERELTKGRWCCIFIKVWGKGEKSRIHCLDFIARSRDGAPVLSHVGADWRRIVCCSLASPAHTSAFNRLHRASATGSYGERERETFSEFPHCKSLASSPMICSPTPTKNQRLKGRGKKSHFRSMRGNTTPGR
jgi:hypothetical protein